MDKENIVVWFSCGAASAVAAYFTINIYGKENVRVVNNPVKEEHEDNLRFLKDVEKWLGVKIEKAINSKYPCGSAVSVWKDRKFMGGVHGAPCTIELKKAARYEFENKNIIDWHVLGFTYDEQKRAERFKTGERENLLTPLIDEKVTKQDCFDLLARNGVKLPEIYLMGFPNANCIGCVKATSPTYWNKVREHFPEEFKKRAAQSKAIGAKLVRVKGERIFLSELKTTDQGRPLKNYKIDCGIFCEEDIKEQESE